MLRYGTLSKEPAKEPESEALRRAQVIGFLDEAVPQAGSWKVRGLRV